jgi:hypothetical protein
MLVAWQGLVPIGLQSTRVDDHHAVVAAAPGVGCASATEPRDPWQPAHAVEADRARGVAPSLARRAAPPSPHVRAVVDRGACIRANQPSGRAASGPGGS